MTMYSIKTEVQEMCTDVTKSQNIKQRMGEGFGKHLQVYEVSL